MNFLKKNWKKLLGLVLIIALIGGYQRYKTNQAAQKIKNPAIVKLDLSKESVIRPETKNISQSINLTGKIQAESFAKLAFQTGGQLSWLGVKVGDKIKKYQPLASLDKSQLKKTLEKNLQDFSTTRSNFEDTQDSYKVSRDKLLLTTDMQRVLDRSQYGLNKSVLDVELTSLALKYATLISPIDGIVVEVNQPVSGINIVAGSPIVTIVDPKSIYFRSEVDEEDVVKIHPGQASQISLDSYKDQPVNTNIGYIAFDSLESKAATVYEVRFPLVLDNTNLNYRLGMNGNVNIINQTKNNVLTLPLDAIYEEGSSKFVYRLSLDGTKKLKTPVTTGIDDSKSIEIISGLTLEDKVVVPNYVQNP